MPFLVTEMLIGELLIAEHWALYPKSPVHNFDEKHNGGLLQWYNEQTLRNVCYRRVLKKASFI